MDDKPWKCAVCSLECQRYGLIGSYIYNCYLGNHKGGQNGTITPREGTPTKYTASLRYRSALKQTPDDIFPLCRTCWDMCDAISEPPRRELKKASNGEMWDEFYTVRITEYFVKLRTQEWEQRNGYNNPGKQLT